MAFAIRLAFLCSVVVATLAAARPSGAFAPFLDRMRAHAGPVWREHLHSTSHLMRDGERTDVSTDASGPRFFTRQCIGQVCVGTYFDGTHVFATNLNDTALPRSNESAEALRALRAISSLTFLAPEFAASGGVVEDAQF